MSSPRRLVEYCACGAALRPDNTTGICAECRWLARDERLRRIEDEQRRNRRAAVVAQRISQLDQGGP
ncbi:hypothetical protein [Mycobacterium montefiorense]|uniref:hypothetical protein n=1 Tax=Mycobacterium montefiorense TaxID=154654 RepID=UPI001057A878|nr:hypothetical protein [Mycobacterium montefiorense]